MASGSTKIVRWPWLILAGLGFIGCIAFLILSLTGKSRKESAMLREDIGTLGRGAPSGKGAPPAPMVGGVPAERHAAPAPAAPAPIAPPSPAPEPSIADARKPEIEQPLIASKAGKKAPRPAAPRVAPTKIAAPAKPLQRVVSMDKDDDADSPSAAPPASPAPEGAEGFGAGSGHLAKPESPKKHKRGRTSPSKDAKEQKDSGHAVAKGPKGPPGEEEGDEHGKAESKAFADLLPGRFSAKVPERMLINESVRVRATVSEKKDEKKATAVLEAAPVGPGPSKIVTEEVLVGKLLRVELRGLSREFEIMPITPPEQRVYSGHVAQWEWVVVPREEGQHELSIVVTNLFDWSGRPLDLTVHSSLVAVDVTTMQRLRGYASVVSSIFSGITGLIGAWMALLRPFLKRRAEKEEEEKEKKKEAKEGGDDKPPEKTDDKPADKPVERPGDSPPVAAPPAVAATEMPQKPAG